MRSNRPTIWNDFLYIIFIEILSINVLIVENYLENNYHQYRFCHQTEGKEKKKLIQITLISFLNISIESRKIVNSILIEYCTVILYMYLVCKLGTIILLRLLLPLSR